MAGVLGVVIAAAVPAQSEGFEVALRDGSVVRVTQVRGNAERGFELLGVGAPRSVAAGEVLAIHGAAAVEPELPVAWLTSGEVLRGPIVGGDSGGSRFEVQSPTLGRLALAVDRLAAFVVERGLEPERITLPNGVEEALFVKAAIGHDVVAGTLHQFGELGVRFQPEGTTAPRWYRSTEFAALRLAGAPPPASARTWLVTRTAERLAFPRPRADEDVFHSQLGDVPVAVRGADVACLCFGDDVVFASDLVPTTVEESGRDGDVVWPWRADRNVVGGPLVAAGRTHAKGLGVHSRSRLEFTVPAGCDRFWTRVALDDGTLALPVRADANAQVEVGGKVVFRADGLRAGQPPRDSGLLPVRPGDRVALVVDFGKARDLGDRVDWLSPVFLGGAAKRP